MREHHMVMALTYPMDKTGKIKEVFTYQALRYSVTGLKKPGELELQSGERNFSSSSQVLCSHSLVLL